MIHVPLPYVRILTTVGALIMALFVAFVRIKASKKPVSFAKIVMPPIGMTTGFCMFLFPEMRIPGLYALSALLIGNLLSYPLIRTSKFVTLEGEIYLQRSKAFLFVLFGLIGLRLFLHSYVEQYITLPQTGAVFFILAYGMIVPWRITMLTDFLQVRRELAS